MKPSHVQFFSTYFAEGVQGVGKNYLRHQASAELGGDLLLLQILFNLLPEYGSLPWTLKPFLMLLAEHRLRAVGRQKVAVASALLCGSSFAWLALGQPSGMAVLLCAALMSTGSAVVDGLIDGRVAEASSDEQRAAECRYLCECGHFAGAVVVSVAVWAFSLKQATMLALAAGVWVAAALCIGMSGPGWTQTDEKLVGSVFAGLRSLTTGSAPLAVGLTFIVCLSPSIDFFLFRQQVLGLTAPQQALVSLLGSGGFFLGNALYKHVLAADRSVHAALAGCLLLWPVGSCFSILVAWCELQGTPALALAALEKAVADFSTAMTFMPCNVLMQMHAPRGCESSGFALMQLGGTLGSILARNSQYGLLALLGVSPKDGWTDFPKVLGVAAAWRLCTAVTLRCALVPLLARPAAGGASCHPQPKRDA